MTEGRGMTKTKTITFENGYRRLQEIADEVNRAEIPVDRMGDLFAEGKGLEKALTDHLAAQKARIEQIERGEEVQTFRIATESANGNGNGNSAESSEDVPF